MDRIEDEQHELELRINTVEVKIALVVTLTPVVLSMIGIAILLAQ
mgnify:CR=1 FL=1